MNSLHKSNETPLDIAPTSLMIGTFQTASTATLTGTSFSTTNDVLYIKSSNALAGLNKLEKHSTNPDIAELANVFHTIFNFN